MPNLPSLRRDILSLSENLRQRGLLSTTRAVVSGTVLRPFRHYLDGAFDRRWGTETAGIVRLADLQIPSDNRRFGIWYEPMPVDALRRILDTLDVTRYPVFIDYGSGKGRVLMVASQYGFRTVLGVEFSPALHRIAERNIQIYSGQQQGRVGIRSICMDAVDFVPPPEPCVLFFYSPFRQKVLRQVLGRIEDSVARHPRPLALAFFGLNPQAIACLDALGWRRRELQPIWNPSRVIQYRALTYEAEMSLTAD